MPDHEQVRHHRPRRRRRGRRRLRRRSALRFALRRPGRRPDRDRNLGADAATPTPVAVGRGRPPRRPVPDHWRRRRRTAPGRSRSTSRRPAGAHLPEYDCRLEGRRRPGPAGIRRRGVARVGIAAGTGFNVYGDPCHWSTTIPETPATTLDEIVAALAAQASTRRVGAGGRHGGRVRRQGDHAPRADVVRPAERAPGGRVRRLRPEHVRSYGPRQRDPWCGTHQGPGQIDELWILDVDGSIVILDAAYQPGHAGRPRRRAAAPRRIGHLRGALTDRDPETDARAASTAALPPMWPRDRLNR